jgi:hypothetical protein
VLPGVNVTLKVHDDPAATEPVQVLFVIEKPLVAAIPVIVSADPPLFVKVTFCAELVLPIASEGKDKVAGAKLIAAPELNVTAFDMRLMIKGCPTISTYTGQLPEGTREDRSSVLVPTARFDATL